MFLILTTVIVMRKMVTLTAMNVQEENDLDKLILSLEVTVKMLIIRITKSMINLIR